ncbi:hypothetical protein GWI33_021836 [Rhynchophorus ferrugineus]|uniref:Uncharacterized protein n=1 Tax=Rhynchophorus ferrugineus TaxID=354439 RepID=A0A834IVG8_RHYFE|nr:hypothetical protein GWI33_021836 [Rhynchophorus ferrugineus]
MTGVEKKRRKNRLESRSQMSTASQPVFSKGETRKEEDSEREQPKNKDTSGPFIFSATARKVIPEGLQDAAGVANKPVVYHARILFYLVPVDVDGACSFSEMRRDEVVCNIGDELPRGLISRFCQVVAFDDISQAAKPKALLGAFD